MIVTFPHATWVNQEALLLIGEVKGFGHHQGSVPGMDGSLVQSIGMHTWHPQFQARKWGLSNG